jgi:DNA-binding CsgD family transcriptional regulator/PAS domain-containing protein
MSRVGVGLNTEQYQKILEFAKMINPLELHFHDKVIDNLKQIFGFTKIILETFTDQYPSFFDMPTSFQEEQSGKVIFLRNEKKKCIGLLIIYEDISSGTNYQEDNIVIDEIAKIIEKSLQIHMRFYSLKVNFSMLQNMISKFPVAIILCNNNFHILHINQAAVKILELFKGKISLNIAEDIIKNKILPNYIQSGIKEYTLATAEYQLQISVQNQIIHDIEKDTYITCYQITINCSGKMIETKWNEFLLSKELTKRECEISNLMRLGYTNDEIASNLHISVNTMKRHRENIYRKLNISRINQLNILFETMIRKV